MQEYDDEAGNQESLVIVEMVACHGGKRCGLCGQSAIDKAGVADLAERQQHRRIRFGTGRERTICRGVRRGRSLPSGSVRSKVDSFSILHIQLTLLTTDNTANVDKMIYGL